ncbi:hypothetical protein BST14_23220 [Mycobacterium arosiense ATCC BAA-1401 = DSM 45069]|uniref:NADH:flavin oxidoreductase/NADH oxidase N-terminal domain-containing protein n=1 Tax=Mycobacterium arosiense ATCC BAA-1401 = DSM 45069 TaxID=1265311 RepID=A0A1W9Z7X6_MYCAI|nr:hypothetical protein BST14_23220 [Mycobacterium arosiense ATCC BAA-1401 = DSM 45069]
MTSFPHLMAPGRIGAMTVRNRPVMSLMETMHGTPHGLPCAAGSWPPGAPPPTVSCWPARPRPTASSCSTPCPRPAI